MKLKPFLVTTIGLSIMTGCSQSSKVSEPTSSTQQQTSLAD
ncbi:formylglycine-generating enzyme family protein, partial [Acinetobacter baumannii]